MSDSIEDKYVGKQSAISGDEVHQSELQQLISLLRRMGIPVKLDDEAAQ